MEYGDAAGIADGVYTGTGTGYRGEMSVEVTVKDEQINKIEVTETVDDAKWFDRAYSTIASEIISSQKADVDTVSGATYSSMGIKEAVANALINAVERMWKLLKMIYLKVVIHMVKDLKEDVWIDTNTIKGVKV
jgi:uncharacterized protein with FMN-binding domain